jgi:hypothetical protein
MPTISRFYGITITLRPAEARHSLPHFHASYAGFEASIAVETGEILRGTMPRRALVLIADWASLHRLELLTGWQALKEGRLPASIAPLD